MYLNGAMVIDNDGHHAMRTRSSLPLDLQGNSFNRITILYFNRAGNAGVRLQYSGPDSGGQLVTVPSSVLSHGEYDELPTVPYTYDSPSMSPMITNMTETKMELELTGESFGSSGTVTLGIASNPATNFQCTVSTWTDTSILCTRPTMPSGAWQVRVHTEDGWSNPAPLMVWVPLTVEDVESNGVTVSATTSSEPWILVMKISQGTVLGYESELWTNAELLNPTSPEDMPDNAKYQAYLDTPFKRLRACVGSSNGRCVQHSFDVEWSSAQALFSAGYIPDSTVDQAGWIQALGATPGSFRACPMIMPGFNLECPEGNRARWGFCANCPSQSCHSDDADAAVGIGLNGQNSPIVGAGWTSYFASGGGTCSGGSETYRDVWLWVENLEVTNGGLNGVLYSGYGGGEHLTIQGTGLGFEPAQSHITVCGEPCEVKVSNGTTVVCELPSMTDQNFINAFPDAFPSIDLATMAAKFYTDYGEQEAIDISMGLGTRSGCWFGFELPPSKEAFLTAVDFFPPTDPNRRSKARGQWRRPHESIVAMRTPRVTSLSPDRGTARGDTLVTLYGEGVGTGNAEIFFNGYPCIPQEANSTALSCMTTERNAGINAPSTTVMLQGRGYAIISERAEDTVFRYVDKWSNIYSWLESEPPVDGDSVVVPEGQAIMLDVNSPKLFLLLISGYFEFDRQDLMLNSTYIWIAGGSFYVGSEAAPFLHQATITLHGDRWHTIELPVIGSKMLAVTDLGGLGTCAHLYKREVRLSSRGDHYVDPCPVKLVGRMELHGKTGISWTRLVETAEAGSSLLKVEEARVQQLASGVRCLMMAWFLQMSGDSQPGFSAVIMLCQAVDWEVGVEVVITPTERGHQEEAGKSRGR
eukprot:Skav218218  [mRNA]  locus=scaffold1375:86487:92544:- [translate_table: standard]